MHEYLDPVVLAKLEDLELIARTVVEGFLHGLHRSPYVGFSVEFASHREYLPGDDLRHLNWKLYARNDKLYVKQYDAETNLDCHLVRRRERLDGDGECGRLEAAVCDDARRGDAHLALKQRDAVGLTLFADGSWPTSSRGRSRTQLDEILSALATAPGDTPAAARRPCSTRWPS